MGRGGPTRQRRPASAPSSSAPGSSSPGREGRSGGNSRCSASGWAGAWVRGRNTASWITLDDEVGVIMRCLEDTALSGRSTPPAPTPVTDATLAKAIGAALHRPSAVAVPSTALRLALGSEMATELILGGQRVLPEVLLSQGHTFAHTDVDEAVRSVLAGGPGGIRATGSSPLAGPAGCPRLSPAPARPSGVGGPGSRPRTTRPWRRPPEATVTAA